MTHPTCPVAQSTMTHFCCHDTLFFAFGMTPCFLFNRCLEAKWLCLLTSNHGKNGCLDFLCYFSTKPHQPRRLPWHQKKILEFFRNIRVEQKWRTMTYADYKESYYDNSLIKRRWGQTLASCVALKCSGLNGPDRLNCSIKECHNSER